MTALISWRLRAVYWSARACWSWPWPRTGTTPSGSPRNCGRTSPWSTSTWLTRETDLAPARVVLVSTHAEEDYTELISACPVAGFLPKTRLSAPAIRDLLGLPA